MNVEKSHVPFATATMNVDKSHEPFATATQIWNSPLKQLIANMCTIQAELLTDMSSRIYAHFADHQYASITNF